MITKLNIYNESVLIPRNIEGRKEKLRQENIKLLSQEIINGDLRITEDMLTISSELVKVKRINGFLYCANLGLYELPEWFKNIEVINGYFSCSYNKLTSLKNCPQYMTGAFYCNINGLLSLEYGPKFVGGNYNCFSNRVLLTRPEECKIEGKFLNQMNNRKY